MRIKGVAGCCSTAMIYDLGAAHQWKKSVVTYESIDKFEKALATRIEREEYDHFIAITSGEQREEREWFDKLGFKSLRMDGWLTLHHITLNYWYRSAKKRKEAACAASSE